jgi:hypothetical protein
MPVPRVLLLVLCVNVVGAGRVRPGLADHGRVGHLTQTDPAARTLQRPDACPSHPAAGATLTVRIIRVLSHGVMGTVSPLPRGSRARA